jgi:hypothetical protein
MKEYARHMTVKTAKTTLSVYQDAVLKKRMWTHIVLQFLNAYKEVLEKIAYLIMTATTFIATIILGGARSLKGNLA